MRKPPMLLVFLTLLFIAGCAQAPIQDIEAAKAAVEAAREANADSYAADEFKAAQDALTSALAEVEAQNSKFPLTRNYDKAVQALKAAKEAADKAKANAGLNKEKAKKEAEALIAEAQSAVAAAKEALAKAPRGKDTKADIEAMNADLSGLESSLNQANQDMSKQDYLGAKAKAQAVKEKAATIQNDVQQAIEKAKGLRKDKKA